MTPLIRSALITTLVLAALAARAEVYVQPTKVLVKETTRVNSGYYSYYELTLNRGTELVVEFEVSGASNTLDVWLLDLANFQRFRARQQFSYLTAASGTVEATASYRVTVPQTSIYYLVLDNQGTFLAPRQVYTYAYGISDTETEDSKRTKEFYSQLYNDVLKALFVFDDFDIHVEMCGTANAFSSPDIIICNELNDLLFEKNVPGAMMFVFLHEVAHSLLNVWDYPLYDNEDAADELATALLLMAEQEAMALQAAKWWAQDMSTDEALSKLWLDDRHTVSPQRARNIINWINNKEELTRRWSHLLIPKMTDEVLQEGFAAEDPDDAAKIALAVQYELIKRRAIARANLLPTN